MSNSQKNAQQAFDTLEVDTLAVLSGLQPCESKGLQTIFDCLVGRSTVNHPLWWSLPTHPTGGICAEIASSTRSDSYCAFKRAQGFNLYLAEWSPYHGAAYAVIGATARFGGAGANWSNGSGAMKTNQDSLCLVVTVVGDIINTKLIDN